MKPPMLAIVLLAPALAFGQKFQDVTAKGAPVSLSVKADYPDMGPYAAVRNNSTKGILLMFSIVKTPVGVEKVTVIGGGLAGKTW
jgi:hypothetical protein